MSMFSILFKVAVITVLLMAFSMMTAANGPSFDDYNTQYSATIGY